VGVARSAQARALAAALRCTALSMAYSAVLTPRSILSFSHLMLIKHRMRNMTCAYTRRAGDAHFCAPSAAYILHTHCWVLYSSLRTGVPVFLLAARASTCIFLSAFHLCACNMTNSDVCLCCDCICSVCIRSSLWAAAYILVVTSTFSGILFCAHSPYIARSRCGILSGGHG